LATILNAKLLPQDITYVRRITVSYPRVDCSVRYSSVTMARVWDCSHCGKSFSFCDRKLDASLRI